MKKNLITIALALSLSACGGGNSSSTTDDDNSGGGATVTPTPTPNTLATFSGTSTAEIDVTSTVITNTAMVSDVDAGEAVFTPQTDIATAYGNFSIAENGQWTYEIDTNNNDVIALVSDASLTDTISITSADGTSSTIIVTINKADNSVVPATPAMITGSTSANVFHTAISATGALSITDINDGEAEFTSSSAAQYGTFSISAAGLWTYNIDQANSAVSTLASGNTLTDSITVTSIDGTQATLTINIEYAEGDVLITPTLPVGILTVPSINCDTTFNNVGDLESAVSREMVAGTTLCLADGEYTSDFEITFGGAGTEDAPITIAAQNPGKAILKGGEVSIKMGGSYAQLQGFVFEDILYGSKLIETRNNSDIASYCSNCRITELTIVNPKATSSGGTFISVYGSDVWVDRNIFSGKTSANPMVSLIRELDSDVTEDEAIAKLAKGTVVYKNYFANRLPAGGKMYANNGDNDYEAIRTGLSESHHFPSNSMIVDNLFERIQGEAEVVSNKGTNNVISGNTVRNSYGSITNRHGNTTVINNNFIFGDGHPFAGGLRIADDGHTITNNYIEAARYKDTSHHGGIVILGYDGAGDGDNGYQQVENVHIAHNTIVDSVNSVNIDGGDKSDTPKKVYFANNIIDRAVGDVFVDTERGVTSDSAYAGNIVYGSGDLADSDSVSASDLGATFIAAMLEKGSDGLYRSGDNSPSLTAVSYEKANFPDVTVDMDGTSRGDITEAGADDVNGDTPVIAPLTYADVGPQSYDYTKPDAIIVEADIANADFEAGSANWTGGTIIDTSAGAFAGNGLSLSGSNTAVQSGIVLTGDSNYAISAFVKGTYSFAVNNHSFEGEITSSDYKYVVHEFTTDSSETSGVITLKVAEQVTVDAGVQDGNMDNFRNDSGSLGVWITSEDSGGGLGDLGSSGDSAFSSGSARARFKTSEGQIHDFTATPGLSQSLTGVATGVDLTYSLYYCDKKGDDSLTTLHYGLKDSNGTVIAEARAHVSQLDDALEGTSKDCFKQVILDVPNNTTSEIEIFAVMEVDSTLTEAQIYAHEQYIDDDLEVRIDEFSLTYQGTPDASAEVQLDEVRLVKRTIDELSD